MTDPGPRTFDAIAREDRRSRQVLGAALFALSVLFSAWFIGDAHRLAAMLVFGLPPLLLVAGLLAGRPTAPFWAGVLGLFWFCHGVTVAWGRPGERAHGWMEIILALVIIVASSWPGLRARVFKRR